MKRRRTNESTIHIPDGSYRSEPRRGNSLRSEPRLPKINLPDSGGSAQRLRDVLITAEARQSNAAHSRGKVQLSNVRHRQSNVSHGSLLQRQSLAPNGIARNS